MGKVKIYPEKINNLKEAQDFIRSSLLVAGKYKGSQVQRYVPLNLWNDIDRESKKLGLNSDNRAEQLLWIYNGYLEYPKKCLECSKPISEFESFNIGYLVDYCCGVCANNNVEVKLKKIESFQLSYGVDYGFQSNEVKEKSRLTFLNTFGVEHNMKSKEGFEKNMKAQFRLKDFILPSGRVIQVQGYEGYVLEYLLTFYEEKDFVFDVPVIKYGDKSYHPDFYIVKDNLIVEVKSDFTYRKDLEKNLMKREACLEQGYDFKFYIWDKKKDLIII